MASGITELIDMLYSMVDEAKSVPLAAGKCMVERDQMLDLIEEVRAQLPTEISDAKKLMEARNDYIAGARKEADIIKQKAEEEAKYLTSQENTLARAREQGEQVMLAARTKAKELMSATNRYCEEMLSTTEAAMAKSYETMREAHTRFRAAANTNVGSNTR